MAGNLDNPFNKFIGLLSAFLLGMAFIYAGSKEIWLFCSSQNWSHTTGIISSSYVETSQSNRGTISHTPSISYQYEVEGSIYSNEQIYFGGSFGQRSFADVEPLVLQFPEGKQVTVYYNPNDPKESVLNRDYFDYWSCFIMLLLGGLFITLPIDKIRSIT
ncbi:MAG: DUF3592 domain-containing protein [Desulfamplus sp.]|nr:DUF3592 domain-containing protein [Desulfamplus sp.]